LSKNERVSFKGCDGSLIGVGIGAVAGVLAVGIAAMSGFIILPVALGGVVVTGAGAAGAHAGDVTEDKISRNKKIRISKLVGRSWQL